VDFIVVSGSGGGGGGGSGGLGFGQTWQNLTASRAANQTYTNATESPIQISITVGGAGTSELSVNAVPIARENPNNGLGQISAIIPPGANYSLFQASPSISIWAELR
jgi:hypothetical protein